MKAAGAMLSYNRNRAVGIISDNYSTLQDSLFGWIADTLNPTRFGADPDTRFTAARMLWSAVHGIVLLNYLGQASDETRPIPGSRSKCWSRLLSGGQCDAKTGTREGWRGKSASPTADC
ncbi:MAG: TetR-like C-terminal domain-containing protein [Nitratireductor sp.]